jgi:hypothetical protein
MAVFAAVPALVLVSACQQMCPQHVRQKPCDVLRHSNGRPKGLDGGPCEPCVSHAGGGPIMLGMAGGSSIKVQPLHDASNIKIASQRYIAFPRLAWLKPTKYVMARLL